MAAHARTKPRPVLLESAGAVGRVWHGWQRSRPFSGALLAIAGGTEIMLVSLAPPVHSTRVIVPIGTLIAGGILACALLLLFDPAQRSVYATAAILLAVSALTTSHLGGYLIGTVLAVAGGAMAFAWVPRVPSGRRVRVPIPGFTLIRGEGGLHPGPGGSHPGHRRGPSLAPAQPYAAAPTPDVAAQRPDVTAPGPDVTAFGPGAAAPGPNLAATRPDLAAIRPEPSVRPVDGSDLA